MELASPDPRNEKDSFDSDVLLKTFCLHIGGRSPRGQQRKTQSPPGTQLAGHVPGLLFESTSTPLPAKPAAFRRPRAQGPNNLLPSTFLVQRWIFTVSLRDYRARNKEEKGERAPPYSPKEEIGDRQTTLPKTSPCGAASSKSHSPWRGIRIESGESTVMNGQVKWT